MNDELLNQLDRRLRITQLAFAIAIVALAVATGVALTNRQQVAPPSRLQIGGVTLDNHGLVAVAGDPKVAPNVVVRVQPDAAFVAVGAGGVGITQGVDRDSELATIAVTGRVDSTLEINTANGAWTVVRSYRDPHGNVAKTERVKIVAEMAP